MVDPGHNGVNSPAPGASAAVEWVVLALGSNLGDRRAHLAAAAAGLEAEGYVATLVSPILETAPVGGPPGQGPYLNQVLAAPRAEVETRLGPAGLLAVAQRLEAARGRLPEGGREPWGPRPLDIDLVVWGGLVSDDPRLTLPHPRAATRWFVLGPLAAILPDLVLPGTLRTVAELARALHPDGPSRTAADHTAATSAGAVAAAPSAPVRSRR